MRIRKSHIFLSLLIVVGVSSPLVAQNNLEGDIDSLTERIKKDNIQLYQSYDSLLVVFNQDTNQNNIPLLFQLLEDCPIDHSMRYVSKAEPLLKHKIEQADESNKRQLLITLAEVKFRHALYLETHKRDYRAAIKINFEELKLRKRAVDTINIGRTYKRIIRLYEATENYAGKFEILNDQVKTYTAWNSLKNLSEALYKKGMFFGDLDEYDHSIRFLRKAQAVERRIGDSTRITGGLLAIGEFFYNHDQYDSALYYLIECRSRASQYEDYGNVIRSKFLIGHILLDQGKTNESIQEQREVYQMAIEIEQYEYVYYASIALAECYRQTERFSEAEETYLFLIEGCMRMGPSADPQLHRTYKDLAELYFQIGDYARAKRTLQSSLNWIRLHGKSTAKLSALRIAYKTDSALGNYSEALSAYQHMTDLSNEIASKDILMQESKRAYKDEMRIEKEANKAEQLVKDAKIAKKEAEIKSKELSQLILFGGLALALLFGAFIFNRFRVTSKQKGIIEEQKQKVDLAYDQLEEKNTEILDSINYAKRIQSAILPSQNLIKQYLENSFVLYRPKDIVAGDFYWMEPTENSVLFAAADCTGHGVPGALVSVVCNNGLNRSVREYGLTDPGEILDKTREIVIGEFEKSEEEVKDGMDVALCSLNKGTLKYAGAHNPLWIVRNGSSEVHEIKANKQPIGKFDNPLPYTTHDIQLDKGDTLYIFSDGYPDQFGGEKGKKYKSGNLKKFLLSIQAHPMEKQRELLIDEFESWRRGIEQIDDVCILGVRI